MGNCKTNEPDSRAKDQHAVVTLQQDGLPEIHHESRKIQLTFTKGMNDAFMKSSNAIMNTLIVFIQLLSSKGQVFVNLSAWNSSPVKTNFVKNKHFK